MVIIYMIIMCGHHMVIICMIIMYGHHMVIIYMIIIVVIIVIVIIILTSQRASCLRPADRGSSSPNSLTESGPTG